MKNYYVFDNRAESYVSGRLGYAPDVADMICRDILKPDDTIADIGSGSGIFAMPFIERGFDVFCVEPNEGMRQKAEQIFSGNPHFISVAASAEDTTLPSGSINLVTAASAFHWFDEDLFKKECLRILKPDGVFLAVINARDYSDPFTLLQHDICKKFCPNFISLRHGLDKSIPKFEHFFGKGLNHIDFDFPLEYTKEQFIQRSLSSSYAPVPGSSAEKEYISALSLLIDKFFPNSDKIIVPNLSVVYWGRLI